MCSCDRLPLRRSAADPRSRNGWPSRRPPGCRKTGAGVGTAGSGSCLDQGGMPFLAVGDDVQESLCGWHVVGVAGDDGLPGVAARVGLRDAERLQEPGLSVGAVIGEGLAGPFAGDQHAPPGVAEVLTAVGFALAGPRAQAGTGVAWLDAVAEPVRAGRRA